jgi:hypothetical protein
MKAEVEVKVERRPDSLYLNLNLSLNLLSVLRVEAVLPTS